MIVYLFRNSSQLFIKKYIILNYTLNMFLLITYLQISIVKALLLQSILQLFYT